MLYLFPIRKYDCTCRLRVACFTCFVICRNTGSALIHPAAKAGGSTCDGDSANTGFGGICAGCTSCAGYCTANGVNSDCSVFATVFRMYGGGLGKARMSEEEESKRNNCGLCYLFHCEIFLRVI